MAKISYFEPLLFRPLTGLFDDDTFGIELFSKRKIVFEDGYGARVELQGRGLSASHDAMISGTVTSVSVKDVYGNLLFTVDNAHLGATQISNDFETYGVASLIWVFAEGDDKLVGSRASDLIEGYSGSDVLKGRGSVDHLLGASGNDILTGGGGSDAFVFFSGFDVDTVTDFQDEGKNQDIIWISRSMFNSMDKSKRGDDVVLDFGSGDQLIIEHARVAEIGRNDFHFN